MEIPIFTSQLEKAREATDAANLRAAYAEVVSGELTTTSNNPVTKDVAITQKTKGWQDSSITKIGDQTLSDAGLTNIKEGDVLQLDTIQQTIKLLSQ